MNSKQNVLKFTVQVLVIISKALIVIGMGLFILLLLGGFNHAEEPFTAVRSAVLLLLGMKILPTIAAKIEKHNDNEL